MSLGHENDIVISTYEIYSMLIACYVLVHGNDIVTNTYEIHRCCYLRNIPDIRHILLG